MLRDAYERTIFENMYHDKPMGVVFLRSESIGTCGERDDSKSQMINTPYEKIVQAKNAAEERNPTCLSFRKCEYLFS